MFSVHLNILNFKRAKKQCYTNGKWFRLVLTCKVDNLNNIHSNHKHACVEAGLVNNEKNLYSHFTFSVLWNISKQGETDKIDLWMAKWKGSDAYHWYSFLHALWYNLITSTWKASDKIISRSLSKLGPGLYQLILSGSEGCHKLVPPLSNKDDAPTEVLPRPGSKATLHKHGLAVLNISFVLNV